MLKEDKEMQKINGLFRNGCIAVVASLSAAGAAHAAGEGSAAAAGAAAAPLSLTTTS